MQKTFKVKIEGISPYLMHKFSMEKQSNTRPGVPNWEAEAEKALYKNPKGEIYIPSSQIHSCLINAGKDMRIEGKGKATYSKKFGAFVLIDPYELVISPQKYEIDEKAVVVQKSRIIRFRPRWDKWTVEFEVHVLEEGISGEIVKEALDYGGRYAGIGDFRPEKKGPFGRFHVVEFKEVK